MSSRSSSYEDFLNLPRRVFFDSSVLQNVHKYGEVLFENQELGTEAHIHKWEEGPAEIMALRNILVVSQRAEFQFAISRSSLKEVARKEDSTFLDWARDMLRRVGGPSWTSMKRFWPWLALSSAGTLSKGMAQQQWVGP